jgi:hypothetical protein
MRLAMRATERLGLGIGTGFTGAGGRLVYEQAGGVTTIFEPNGSIIVQRGRDIVLRLVP